MLEKEGREEEREGGTDQVTMLELKAIITEINLTESVNQIKHTRTWHFKKKRSSDAD